MVILPAKLWLPDDQVVFAVLGPVDDGPVRPATHHVGVDVPDCVDTCRFGPLLPIRPADPATPDGGADTDTLCVNASGPAGRFAPRKR